jgi:hypothetical protein
MSKNADYRKHNDHSQNSSTYHKKDGTNLRAKLKKEGQAEAVEATEDEDKRPSMESFMEFWPL